MSARNEAERAVQAVDLRDLPGRPRGDVAHSVLWRWHLRWASDCPHPDSVWPNSQQAIERQMRHLSLEMRRKLTHDNAAALYGLGGA